MFPLRIPFYTYSGLLDAVRKYPAFTGTGDADKREAAVFLADIDHESGELRYVEETNQANWPLHCDRSQPYGCPAGQSAYHGRGPIQLSWNFNDKAAGDALGIDLLNNPDRVKNEASVAWQTGVWYWMTQNGPNSQTAHAAITGSQGFGGTIRSINGALECDGRNPATVANRVATYQRFAHILRVNPGGNLSC
jgi:predicted chitinase